MHIELPDVSIGVHGDDGPQLDFTHEGGDSVWKGQGKLCIRVGLRGRGRAPGQTPPGGIVIRNGELERAFVNVEFPDPGSRCTRTCTSRASAPASG